MVVLSSNSNSKVKKEALATRRTECFITLPCTHLSSFSTKRPYLTLSFVSEQLRPSLPHEHLEQFRSDRRSSDVGSSLLASHAIRQLHGLEKSFEKEAEDLLKKIAFAVRNVSYSDGLLAVISMDSQFWEELIEKAKRSRVEMRGFIVLRIHGFGTLQAGLAKKDDPSGPTDPNSIVGQVIAVLKSSEIANTLASMDTAKKIASIIGDDAGISVVSKDILAIATRQLIATQVNAFLTNDEKNRISATTISGALHECLKKNTVEKPAAANGNLVEAEKDM
ncbi:hypothetical protein L596_021466 [Steinernema carpocapsae]|uniref:Uncharacterized protein n=1 Tax=Steinernema carpocapsae TaxID=34508 RepID=A0A4U5MIV5_STECR|nr:hypothetical protein L596_021466 [Steinernema carpocapsae]